MNNLHAIKRFRIKRFFFFFNDDRSWIAVETNNVLDVDYNI